MLIFPSPVTHLGHESLPELGVPNAITRKYLNMIPESIRGSTSPDVPDSQASSAAATLPKAAEPPSLQPWKEAPQKSRDGFPPSLPVPTVRVAGPTLLERATAIVTAAEDCGRLHSERAKRLYTFLVCGALGLHLARRPGVTVTPNRIVLFFVADELATFLPDSRATIYRAFKDLKAAGLVARRPWYTSSRVRGGNTVAGGVVADVVLTPTQATEARVQTEDLRPSYRHLDADRHAGRTAWKWMTGIKEIKAQAQALEDQAGCLVVDASNVQQINALRLRAADLRQSISSKQIKEQLDHFLRWSLSTPDLQPVMLTISASQDVVYRLGELTTATPEQRRGMIEERAQALCRATGDQAHNINFWRWLLWRTVELDYAQPGHLPALVSTLLRLLTDLKEWALDQSAQRPLRRPGALFISRLKASGWWEALRAPKTA